MQDYYQTTCGWYEEIPYFYDSGTIEDAILYMLYTAGACN